MGLSFTMSHCSVTVDLDSPTRRSPSFVLTTVRLEFTLLYFPPFFFALSHSCCTCMFVVLFVCLERINVLSALHTLFHNIDYWWICLIMSQEMTLPAMYVLMNGSFQEFVCWCFFKKQRCHVITQLPLGSCCLFVV